MSALVISAIILFFILGVIHFYWALGGKTGVDKAIPTVDGIPTIQPSPFLTSLVGIALISIGCLAYLLWFFELNSLSFGNYIIYLGWVLSGVFIIRSIGDFKVIGFFKRIKSSEFAKYDSIFYSPLCLILGAFFAYLAYNKA